jgi:hypothetical protein
MLDPLADGSRRIVQFRCGLGKTSAPSSDFKDAKSFQRG